MPPAPPLSLPSLGVSRNTLTFQLRSSALPSTGGRARLAVLTRGKASSATPSKSTGGGGPGTGGGALEMAGP
eukprot:7330544-Heterocapsa_arctica.AAC.1